MDRFLANPTLEMNLVTMNKQKLRMEVDRLHTLKTKIGDMTYGDASRGKYAMNNLTRTISETLAFLQTITLPDELIEVRNQTLATIEPAMAAINQEYAHAKPDKRGHEVISNQTDRQSEVIRRALGEFDTKANDWLISG